ncbi:hypothetical protein JCM8547_002360 [Rhodosporidiobolus lusitaniae]
MRRLFHRRTDSGPSRRRPTSPSPSSRSYDSYHEPAPRTPTPPPSYGEANAPSVTSVDVDHQYRLVLKVDLDLNLTAPDLKVFKRVESMPFAGKWTILVDRKYGDARFDFDHGDIPRALFGTSVKMKMEGLWVDPNGKATCIRCTTWTDELPSWDAEGERIWGGHTLKVPHARIEEAEEKSKGAYDSTTHRAYRFVVTLEQGYSELERGGDRRSSRKAARAFSAFSIDRKPLDVRLYFPGVHENGAELWANSALLSQASPYFERRLRSITSGSTLHTSRRSAAESVGRASTSTAAKESAGSDDESDAFLFSRRPSLLDSSATSSSPTAESNLFRQLIIEEGAFSTWHACLVFLQSGYIDFLPLSSCFSSRSDTRTSYLSEDYQKDPSLPLPVSPKSVYRLAALLEVSDLKRLALSKYTSRLAVDNIAHELFDDAAIKYLELRTAALDFVKKNWEEVRELDSWKARVEQVGAGDVPGATPILMELWKAGLKM